MRGRRTFEPFDAPQTKRSSDAEVLTPRRGQDRTTTSCTSTPPTLCDVVVHAAALSAPESR